MYWNLKESQFFILDLNHPSLHLYLSKSILVNQYFFISICLSFGESMYLYVYQPKSFCLSMSLSIFMSYLLYIYLSAPKYYICLYIQFCVSLPFKSAQILIYYCNDVCCYYQLNGALISASILLRHGRRACRPQPTLHVQQKIKLHFKVVN